MKIFHWRYGEFKGDVKISLLRFFVRDIGDMRRHYCFYSKVQNKIFKNYLILDNVSHRFSLFIHVISHSSQIIGSISRRSIFLSSVSRHDIFQCHDRSYDESDKIYQVTLYSCYSHKTLVATQNSFSEV